MDTTSPPPVSSPPPTPAQSKGGVWKKVIGIISIIFGSLALLQSATAPFMIPFTRKTMEPSVTDDAGMEKLDAYMEKMTSLSMMSAVILGTLALLLLIGGILLLKQKKIAPTLLMVWAALKMVAGGFLNYKNYLLMQDQFAILSPTAGVEGLGAAEAEAISNITSISAMIGLIVGTLWLMAFPIFLLIWFNRRKIKEEIQGW
ncbi:MAG: hypothetical protein P1U85_04850 [Verrucomicrobiales bacterium]|jgi:hypothetical protein|nr:hypothetical protein [Verrucomicrobiales bacterium]